jgi:hypothetical protein
MKHYYFTCLSGRSPDLRFCGLNAFPVSQWQYAQTKPLTVAGAVTGSAPDGSSSPCSLLCFWPTGVEAPNTPFMTGLRLPRQHESDGAQSNSAGLTGNKGRAALMMVFLGT